MANTATTMGMAFASTTNTLIMIDSFTPLSTILANIHTRRDAMMKLARFVPSPKKLKKWERDLNSRETNAPMARMALI